MAIPPPPGPPPPSGPPPPPAMGGLKLGTASGGGGGDMRSALLQSIQKGTKLKKTTTVDKSGPALSGKICDSSSPASASPKRLNNNNNNPSNTNNNIGNGAPKLGGLFEGLSSMPKLKPVNGSRAPTAPSNTTNNRSGSPPQTGGTTAQQQQQSTSSNGPMDFNAELTKHLTLKRQKQQQSQQPQQQPQQINATEANLRTNRGPPPQPPAAPPKNITSSASDSILERTKAATTTTTTTTALRSSPLAYNNNDTNTKASSPTLSTESGGSAGSTGGGGSKKFSGGTVRSKAANLNLSLGNLSSNHVNSMSSQSTTAINSIHSSSKNTNTTTTKTFKNYKSNTSNTTTTTTAAAMSTTPGLRNVAPNKSSLFGTATAANGGVPLPSIPVTASTTSSAFTSGFHASCSSLSTTEARSSDVSKSPTPGVKPSMPNHGKPNFAPKPPGLQQLALANGGGQRPAVARHHSMKSPRSPPITAPGGPVFPTQQHFGTMRTTMQLCQSQESINSGIRTAPNPPIGRPTVAPPKPPTVKPPPPPTPARSVSNSNLNGLSSPPSAATPISALPPSNSSSSSSVATLRDQFRVGGNATPPPPPPPMTTGRQGSAESPVSRMKSSGREKGSTPIILNGGPIHMPPPLPLHRTCPAPPPPQRQMSNSGLTAAAVTSGGGPPVPPQRHSSIRTSGTPVTPPTTSSSSSLASLPAFGQSSNSVAGTPGSFGGGPHPTSVGRLVIDLESKFGKRFHNVTEFPKPPPFVNFQKIYPSRTTVKATNGTSVYT